MLIIVKGYSAPAILEYNVPKPITPTDVLVKTNMNGLVVTYAPIPAGSHHANIYVNEQRYQSTSNTIFIPIEAGVHKVKVAYVDIFGEGDTSGEQLATVKAEIPPELMKAQNDAIANIDARTKELDKTVQAIDNKVVQTVTNQVTGMSSRITALDNLINQTVRDVNNNVNSQITQVKNSIDLKVTQGLKSLNGQEIISRINLSPEGTRIDGKLLHVTGKAKFDDNIITSKMLQASAVTADKIKVDSLSSITANVGTLTGGTITGSTIIGTTLKNASGTFSVSSEGVIKGATIDAQSFRKSGFEVTALKVENYTLRNGSPLPIPKGFNFEDCRYIILNVTKWVESINEIDDQIERYNFAYDALTRPKEPDILMIGAQHGLKRVWWKKKSIYAEEKSIVKCGVTKNKIVFAFEVKDKIEEVTKGINLVYREGYLDVICIAIKG